MMLSSNAPRLARSGRALFLLAALTLAAGWSAPRTPSHPQWTGASPAAIPGLDLHVDPTLTILSAAETAELDALTRSADLLVLADGDLLRGRVLARGVLLPPGAVVYFEDGAELISSGPFNMILGALAPVNDADADHAHSAAAGLAILAVGQPGEPGEPGEGAEAAGGVAGDPCATPGRVSGANGAKSKTITMTFTGDATVDGGMLFTAPGQGAGGNAPAVAGTGVTGQRSIRVKGGTGGNGSDVRITCSGELTITGTLANARGGDGGDATATGFSATECGGCGGDAIAIGGDGGRAGGLQIAAPTITFSAIAGTLIDLQPNGRGGHAVSTGGAGGDCAECAKGGPGGDAESRGGKGNQDPPAIRLVANAISPALGGAGGLTARTSVPPGQPGGNATANSGRGGHGGPCPCGVVGGAGGAAGKAEAFGGWGGDGYEPKKMTAGNGDDPPSFQGGSGGVGGTATATGAVGGNGGASGTCPCDGGPAEKGGPGGAGGSATANGGQGGSAGGTAVADVTMTSGQGGNAVAVCGLGGNGGASGKCMGDETPIICTLPLEPAKGGAGGIAKAFKGASGLNDVGAGDGGSGTQIPLMETTCMAGAPGGAGVIRCGTIPTACLDPAAGSCCEPHPNPGCGEPICCSTVCAIDFFCCEVQWDLGCVALAFSQCPDCAPILGACCHLESGECFDTTAEGCPPADLGFIFTPGLTCENGGCAISK